ncbi:hypothetical protein ACSSS7_005474 [Eimeria intestinalis]
MKKKPKLFAASTVAEFDFAARRAFITGAAQRKDQRRKLAQAQAAEKQREERRQLRADISQRLSREASACLASAKKRSAAAASTPGVALCFEGNGSPYPATVLRGLGCMENAWLQVACMHACMCGFAACLDAAKQTLRLLPEASASPVASPWLVGSCVSVSLGGFADSAAAHASPAQPLPPAPPPASPAAPAVPAACNQRQQQQQQQQRGALRQKPSTARRVSRKGGQKNKPQKKRHKSRKPLRKRSRHK